MNETILKRQSSQYPDFAKLDGMICYLYELLESPEVNNINEIIDFKCEDGSFNLLNSFDIDSDACIDYCFIPTYICSAIIIKAIMADSRLLDNSTRAVLSKSLKVCCQHNMFGHGYEAMSGQIKAMKIFNRANVSDFIRQYPDICPKFTRMILEISEDYKKYITSKIYDIDYIDDFIDIVEPFKKYTNIFVYGTLLRGRNNYRYYLEPLKPVTTGKLLGYQMFDLGSYPGIVRGDSEVYGEIYMVDENQLEKIDNLEGEGYLYIKTVENIMLSDEKIIPANVYVYNKSIDGCKEIPVVKQPFVKDNCVWYVSYGSNMLAERLQYYIKGGYCNLNGKTYKGCNDTSMPIKSCPVDIPYDMFYSNYNYGSSWGASSVSFLDLSHHGHAFGRAYLIRKDQFEDIHTQEGKGVNWYCDTIELDDIDCIPAYTFSNRQDKTHESFNTVSEKYLSVLISGMNETYPNMSDDEILNYLKSCGK